MKKAISLMLALLLSLSLFACDASNSNGNNQPFYQASERNPEETVRKCYQAIMTANVNTILSLVPDNALDYFTEQEYDGDKQAMMNGLEETLQETIDFLAEEFGTNWKYSYEISSTSNLTGSMFEQAQDLYQEKCGLTIREYRIYTLITTYSGANGSEKAAGTVELVKIGNTWYIDLLYRDWLVSQ